LEQAVLDQLKELVQDAALLGCLADHHWQTLPPLEQARLVRGLGTQSGETREKNSRRFVLTSG
jgi:hypothetical protein